MIEKTKDGPDIVRQIPSPDRAGWHRHPFGGGWVENTAHVEDTVFVDKEASVSGRASATDFVRLLGHAVLADDAVARDHVVISGRAQVNMNAVAEEYAIIADHAILTWDGKASGSAVLRDKTTVGAGATISGHAVAEGSSTVAASLVAGTAWLGDTVAVTSGALVLEGRHESGTIKGSQRNTLVNELTKLLNGVTDDDPRLPQFIEFLKEQREGGR
jgi:carbonic anhydrase/acetyltransferase-like protein (isoleucine patch superfamily)